MARGRKKQTKVTEERLSKAEEPVVEVPVEEIAEDKDEVVQEDQKATENVSASETTVETKEEPPRTLNEYVQQQLAKQEKAREEAKNIKIVREGGKITVLNMPKKQAPKGRLLRNVIVSNSITGWQRTVLQGTEVEIVSESGNRTTIRVFGMLHTIASQYIQKI